MRSFRLRVGYDGTDFHGWQRQPGLRTVQGEVERVLGAVLGRDVSVQGAGRTDAGVHARGQAASFRAETALPAAALPHLLNPRLPADVRVLEAAEAAQDFDARRSARGRRYAYRLLEREDPLLARYAWRPRGRCPIGALGEATRALEGRHDFSSFRSAGSTEGPAGCEVRRARWRAWEGGVLLDIEADRFLYHMVRAVVGTALALADAPDPCAAMRAVLGARDRAAAGANVPPQGLCLEEVLYPPEMGASS